MLFSVLNILSFFLVNLYVAYNYKKRIVQALPVTVAIFVGVLFVLALSRCLSYIDYISVFIILLFLSIAAKKRKQIDFAFIKRIVTDCSFVLYVIVCIFLYFILKNRVAINWDELGCWALEVKTLYFVDGFSLPGFHTIDGYSDYLPGQMLILWWFVHLNKELFNEGLMFVGFYIFYLTCLFYLISDLLKTWNQKYLISLLLGVFLFFSFLILPSAISFLNYEMLCVELLQSSIVGTIVYRFYKIYQESKIDSFDSISFIALSFLLITLKDSSFILILLILLWGYLIFSSRNKNVFKNSFLIKGCIICIIFVIAWRLFVVYNGRKIRRKSVFSDNLNQLFFEQNDLFITDSIKYVRSFLSSIIDYPLHISDCLGLDLNVLSSIFLISFLFFYIAKQNKFSNRITVISIFMPIAINVFYFAIVLFMHVFFFREDQYFNPETMMFSINRYCEPLILGLLFVAISLFAKNNIFNLFIAVCFILMISDLNTVKKWLITYPTEEYSCSIKDNLNKENSYFFDRISELDPQRAYRILFIKDSKDLHIRFVRWFSSPNAIYFLDKNNSDLEKTLKRYLRENEFDFYFFCNNSFIDKNLSDKNKLLSSEELRRILF